MTKRNIIKYEDIIKLLRFLRSPEGCSWDRSKNIKDLKPYILEECHELLEAIDREDSKSILNEIGDILLHCAFLSIIGEENGHFTPSDVLAHLEDKIKRRHPHLFGDKKEEPKTENWEAIKGRERNQEGKTEILDGIPNALPPLLKAFRLQERVSGWKFDWASPDGALEKVVEETKEVEDAYRSGDNKETEKELGDLLFAVVNLSRLLDVHPEEALSKTVRKFAARFDRLTV
jgi:MazG family protein